MKTSHRYSEQVHYYGLCQYHQPREMEWSGPKINDKMIYENIFIPSSIYDPKLNIKKHKISVNLALDHFLQLSNIFPDVELIQ